MTATTATKVWIDGVVHDAATATVPALDHGLTVGDGVFETLKVVDGTPFALRRHLARLRRSATVLDLRLPLSDDELRAATMQVLDAVAATGADPRRLRITVTGGPGPLGSGRDEAEPTVLLAAAPAPPWPAATEVITGPWARNEHSAVAGAKTTSYAENVVALAAAHRRGASEAILANTAGALCEGTGSNLFVVHDGRLCTPSLATGCLAGITRELVLEMVEVDERDDLTLADLSRAEEAFLTSSTRDVQPITTVDAVTLPGRPPGPCTQAAANALADLQSRTLDP